MNRCSQNPVFPSKGDAPEPARTSVSGSASTSRIDQMIKILRHGKRFLVCSHCRPDGDAVGSVLAMGMFLKQLGKQVDLVMADSIPKIHCKLPGAEEICTARIVHGPYDAVILLECDELERTKIRDLEQFFLVNIDHHATGREYANLNWIDRGAASVGEMVYRLVKAAGARITPQMATCLYTTVLTDTGGFRYGSMQASTFDLARELVAAGADPVQIAQNVYFSSPASKLLLLGVALGNLKREGQLAWLWVTRQDMVHAGATEEDCEGIVNFALGVSGVEAAVFLHELPEQSIRLSLRSKGRVNVAAIAAQLGGGGHRSAAGCTLEGTLVSAIDKILVQLRSGAACLADSGA
jgi:bifunctional oligoribonuclease and PAP phosphatase NrnA